MNLEYFRCPDCGGEMELATESQENLQDQIFCKVCTAKYPFLENIPIFGNKDEVEKWTRYHTDPDNVRHVASGGYIAEEPSLHNAYYSRFIPDDASRVLDVGGGDGNTTSHWASQHPGSIVYVMDLSMHGLNKVQRRGLSNMFSVCAPADRRFPFPENYFDVVSTIFMVEHLSTSGLGTFYREAHRVLKPGGRLVVASDTAYYDKIVHPFERLIRHGRYIRNDPTHINLMTPFQCESGIKENGFRLFDRSIHWIAGRYILVKAIYKLFPSRLSEAIFSTMYVIVATKPGSIAK